MAKRDILNHLDVKIGELELPDGTSEEVWEQRLAPYKLPPPEKYIPDVTPRQIRQAWVLMGKQLSEIDDAINALPEPYETMAKIEWEYSISVKRKNPLVEMLGQSQGYSADDLDALWVLAASL